MSTLSRYAKYSLQTRALSALFPIRPYSTVVSARVESVTVKCRSNGQITLKYVNRSTHECSTDATNMRQASIILSLAVKALRYFYIFPEDHCYHMLVQRSQSSNYCQPLPNLPSCASIIAWMKHTRIPRRSTTYLPDTTGSDVT